MRVGFIGIGRIGSFHAEAVRRHPGVTAMVLADQDRDRARQAASRLGCESADSAAEVLKSGVDAVVIASSTDSHADLVIAAVEAGIPVFCEKPVAADIDGTLRVRDQVARGGVPVQVGFQRRFDAGYRAARQAIGQGRLGSVHRVHMITADREPPPAGYISTSGGIWRDCHVHDFDILRWVTGREVADVYALGANRGAEFFCAAGDIDNSAALLSLDDGTLATLQGSRYNGGGYDVRMELAGSKATYAVGLDDHAALISAEPAAGFPSAAPRGNFWERFSPAYQAEIDAFIDVADGTRPSPCTVDEALEALYVAEAATLSRAQGRRVAVAEVRR
jgi:myo-inositol 2-dehydrogenase / D-chiro-inositol 1-dehydrogenase